VDSITKGFLLLCRASTHLTAADSGFDYNRLFAVYIERVHNSLLTVDSITKGFLLLCRASTHLTAADSRFDYKRLLCCLCRASTQLTADNGLDHKTLFVVYVELVHNSLLTVDSITKGYLLFIYIASTQLTAGSGFDYNKLSLFM
jgi:hypothetical protein